MFSPVTDYVLLDYQKKAVNWMKEQEETKHKGGILSLQMGMGKTFISLALGCQSEGINLVICSKTVLLTWIEEIEKFYGKDLPYLVLHSDYISERDVTKQLILKQKFVLSTYDVVANICRKDPSMTEALFEKDESNVTHLRRPKYIYLDGDLSGFKVLMSIRWHRVIADESQRFANPRSKIFNAMMTIPGERRWCLSGTPIRNYTSDLYPQFRFSGFHHITTPTRFKRTTYQSWRLDRKVMSMNYGTVGIVLPAIHKHVETFALSGKTRKVYDHYLENTREMYNKFKFEGSLSFACVLVLFLRLRQVCIAPYLVTQDSKRCDIMPSAGKDLLREVLDSIGDDLRGWVHNKVEAGLSAPKVRKIVDIIKGIVETGEKVIIFSMFVGAEDIIREAVEKDDDIGHIGVAQIDGTVTGQDRSEQIQFFKTESAVQMLFATYKTGAEGLNLTEASHIILCEPWWSPAIHEQAIARSYRTGQTKDVHWWSIIAEDTIEEKVLDICGTKYDIMGLFLGDNHTLSNGIKFDKSMIGQILGK